MLNNFSYLNIKNDNKKKSQRMFFKTKIINFLKTIKMFIIIYSFKINFKIQINTNKIIF